MSQSSRGVVVLSASATAATEWVRGGVVPCHVLAHPSWSVVVPAAGSTAVAAPYDDALTVLASRHVPPRLAPAFGLFRIEDTAVLTARAAGVRAVTRWALRSADGELVASRQLPRLTPESVHRVLGTAAHAREVPVRAVRELWERVDLGHEEWLVEAATVLGLPGARVLAGTDTELGPVVRPAPRSVPAFESVIKDVHQ